MVAPAVRAAARGAVDDHRMDLRFWRALLRHESVTDVLCTALKNKAQRDETFAAHVVAAAAASQVLAAGNAAVAVNSPVFAAKVGSATVYLDDTVGLTRSRPFAAVDSARRRRRATTCDMDLDNGPWWATAATRSVKQRRVGDGAAVSTTPRHRKRAACIAEPTASARRDLAGAFDDDSDAAYDAQPLLPVSSRTPRVAPAKAYKRLPAKPSHHPTIQLAEPDGGGGFLWPIAIPVAVEVVSYLTLQETVGLRVVCRGASDILQHGRAWEPLTLSRSECAGMFRFLRGHDPSGSRAPEKLPMPLGIFQATTLQIDLMDPDQVPLEGEIDHIDFAPAAAPASTTAWCRHRMVLDPIEELCRRLRSCFSAVERLKVANVEDHRMDYRFLQMRTSMPFSSFQHVCLLAGTENRYTLVAERRSAALHQLDNAAAVALSESRRPAGAALVLQDIGNIEEADALFLQEHTDVFKCGETFHCGRAPWRTFSAAAVRKRYSALSEANA